MYRVAQKPWEDVTEGDVSADVQNVEIVATRSELLTSKPLRNSHIVLGLYLLIFKMARRSQWCYAGCFMFIDSIRTGEITIDSIESGIANSTDMDFTIDDLGDWWEIIDPEDSSFKITYEYDGRPFAQISKQDVLSVALDGLATAAQATSESPCTDFAAISQSGDLAIAVRGVRTGWPRLSYDLVKKMLRLLPLDMYRNSRNCEVTFGLYYDGNQLGSGFIRRTPVLDSTTA